MNEDQTRHPEAEHRPRLRAVIVRLAWFAFLFLCVFIVLLYSVASSFPIRGGSEPRTGAAAIHEAIGGTIMDVIHYPFTWLYSYMPDKAASWVILFCWASVIYFISAFLRRPRFVFAARNKLQ